MTGMGSKQDALDAFRKLLGPKGYSDDPDVLSPWLTDWRGRYTGRAAAMLSPANSAEVSALVKIAAAHKIALVPQGGNSGMVAGATPDETGDAVLLSMRRMDQIIGFNEGERTICCEAGVILQNLHDVAASRGLRFPLTLGGKGSATIGGLISTNAGGTQVLRHGTMRALVNGIEAVLPDGSIYDGLSPLKKDNRGYDLKHLMIGAEGTLGIVTAANLQLVPALIDRCVIWAGVESPQAAHQLLLFMQSKLREQLEGFEILPRRALTAVLKHIDGTRPPLTGNHSWHVLMEIVQDDPAADAPGDIAAEIMAQALQQNLIEDAACSVNETQAEAFWKIRDSVAEAERAEGPALQHDISVPVADMARFITDESPQIEAAFPGTQIVAFGHLGDGNIHFHVKAPKDADPKNWYENNMAAISAAVYDRVTSYKGSISAEHGIGQLKVRELARLADPARLLTLRAIKKAMDPDGIMNPGKLVPLA
ncbi:FAD-binding oxidoreductase [Sphingorhabdus arenilitoris]|uniref:FAD-binding oxidoreductase n=1 Tax=Sphingorhabdus arenilitoris TaxID=1490041 RepID=A0ABV8RJN0_9SPHN